jgi:hypothetical protein
MSDAPTNPPRVSIWRIVGGLIVSLGALWIALPFWLLWFLAGPGVRMPKVTLTNFVFSPGPYIALIVILFGLALLGIARGRWLPAVIVALAVWIVALISWPR